MMLSSDGRLPYKSNQAQNSAALPSPTAPAHTSSAFTPSFIHPPTLAHPLGLGELRISFVGLNSLNACGNDRINATSSTGIPVPFAQSLQSSVLTSSSTMVSQRDFNGSIMPLTPASCPVSFVAPTNTTSGLSFVPFTPLASTNCIKAACTAGLAWPISSRNATVGLVALHNRTNSPNGTKCAVPSPLSAGIPL